MSKQRTGRGIEFAGDCRRALRCGWTASLASLLLLACGSESGTKPVTSGISSLCKPRPQWHGIQFEEHVEVANSDTDRVTWLDADGRPRVAAMARVGGGYVRQFIYEVDGVPRVATGTGADGQPGWGYTVNHFSDTYTLGYDRPGSFGPVFRGEHHLLYRYALTLPIAGHDVPVVLEWLFATGRDNPIVAITYNMKDNAPGSLVADTRTPYGDIAWDGDENAASTVVSGVGWGDRHKFVTTSSPLTLDSAWDYTQPNLVPYVFAWTTSPDAEMGAVQTQTYEQHDGGGYWFYPNWGRTSDDLSADPTQVGRMPSTWNWTYQVNQYDLCYDSIECVHNTTSSHRLAWGANYGALGGEAEGSPLYSAYGDDRKISGYPLQSYAVFMVLGKHSDAPTAAQVAQIEASQKARLTASVGSVRAVGPAGVGVDDTVPLVPAGYDARRSAWLVDVDHDRLELSLEASGGVLQNPILIVGGYQSKAAPELQIDGGTALVNRDYVVSRDRRNSTLWITLLGTWQGKRSLKLHPHGHPPSKVPPPAQLHR